MLVFKRKDNKECFEGEVIYVLMMKSWNNIVQTNLIYILMRILESIWPIIVWDKMLNKSKEKDYCNNSKSTDSFQYLILSYLFTYSMM